MKFVEIITWNDWTESSLISPFRGGVMEDGVYQWADLDHSALMNVMVPYIRAYKAGSDSVIVKKEEEGLVYWYRPSLKSASWVLIPVDACGGLMARCDSTDTVGSKPSGWEMTEDSIFVAAMTTGPAEVTVTSGSSTVTQQVGSAGIHTLAFPMKPGKQSFSMKTSSKSKSAQASLDVHSDCYVSVHAGQR